MRDPKSRWKLTLVFICITILAACRPDAGESTANTPDDEPVDWSALPLILDEVPVREVEFGGLTDLAVFQDGRIAAADWVNKEVSIYTADGERLAVSGRAGDGPGEYRGLRFVGVGDDGLIAFDQSLGRLTFLSSGLDSILAVARLDRQELRGSPREDIIVRSASVLIQVGQPQADGDRPDDGEARLVVKEIDRGGRVMRDSILVLPEREWLVTFDERTGATVSPMPFGDFTILRRGPADSLFWTWTGDPRIHVTGPAGESGYSISLPIDRKPVDRDAFEALESSYISYIGPQAAELVYGRIRGAQARGDTPSHFPAMIDFTVDDRGRYWVTLPSSGTELHSTSTGLRYVNPDSTQVGFFDPASGDYGTFMVPGNIVVKAARGSRIYAIATDALDVHSIRIFEHNR